MAKEIHIEIEVNALFREGLKHLLLGFDPFEFADIVPHLKGNFPWTLFVDSIFIEEVLEPYCTNWRGVCSEYFTWQKEVFIDPVDQCTHIKESIGEIFAKLFEGVREDPMNPFFVRLERMTAEILDHLAGEIETWAMTHKFFGDDIEAADIIEEGMEDVDG